MPEIVNCPSCRRKLQVPESLLGQDVQCPTCNATFVASVGGEMGGANSTEPTPESSYRAQPPPRRPYDDYGDIDDYDRPRRRANYAPHRGGTLLTYGILAFVCCWPIFGPMAWSMGNSDLAEIRAGRMDPEGEGLTNAGRICGMIATIFGLVQLAIGCLFGLLSAANQGGRGF